MIAFARQFEPHPSLDEVLKLAVAKMLKDIAENDEPATPPLGSYSFSGTFIPCPSCGVRYHKDRDRCPKCGE